MPKLITLISKALQLQALRMVRIQGSIKDKKLEKQKA